MTGIENWSDKQGSSKSGDDSDGYKAILFIVIGAFTILSLPSLIIGFMLYYFLLRRLKKIEKIFIGATAVLFIVLRFENTIKNYYEWILSVLSISDVSPLSNIPFLEILFIAIIISLLFDIMFSAKISSKFPDKKMFNIFNTKETPISAGILPNDFERENSKLIVSSGLSVTSENIVLDSTSDTQIEKRVNIGVDKEGKLSYLSENEVRTHVLLFGSTGSGKTEAIKTIIGSLLDLGWDGTVLDLKEDTGEGGLAEWCKFYADAHALPYQEITASGEFGNFWFNPLLGMGPDEARDTIVGAQQFDDGYYRSLNEKQLGQLIRLCYTVNQIDPIKYPKVSVYDLGKILASPDLSVATKEMVATVISNYPSVKKDDFDSLIRPDKAMAEAAGGLGARLTALYETEVARRVLRPNENKLEIDITKSGLSYIGLSSSGLPEISRLVSTSILRRMAVFVSDRINGKIPKKHPHFLVIDEANFVNRKMLLELLSRARGAWVPVIVATQGPTDFLTNIPGEPGLESLVQNTNVSIILNQGERNNAELCADIIGRSERLSYSHNVREGVLIDGTGSARSTVDYLVGPDELRRLPQGEGIIRVGKPNEWVRWIKFPLRNPKS
jgi:hypothetical protein